MASRMQRVAAPLLTLVVVLTSFQACLAAVNSTEALTGIIGVWDKAKYNATAFRNDSVLQYFDVWPENVRGVEFHYFCEDPANLNVSLINFTYSLTQGRLDPRPYYDLGVVELNQPYWKHWLFWKVDTRKLAYPINCEYNDLHDLYAYRFWAVTVKNGVIAAAVMQGFIQLIVAVVVVFRWGWTFVVLNHNRSRKLYLRAWFWNAHWGDFFSEVSHLFLLVLVGYSTMEAIGHSDLHQWRPAVMYNTGVIYSYLSLFAVLSSIFRQIAYAWMDPDKQVKFERVRKLGRVSIEAEVWHSLQNISDDWRWQRVFGQLGVLVLMGTYLSFVDDTNGGMDQMAGLVLAASVVACIWSFGVTAVVLFRSIVHILTQIFPVLAKFSIRRVAPIGKVDLEDPERTPFNLASCSVCRVDHRQASRIELRGSKCDCLECEARIVLAGNAKLEV